MTLNDFAIRYDDLFERVTSYGTAQLRVDGASADVTEFDGPDLHYSFEMHNVSPQQLEALLAALRDAPGREVVVTRRHEAGRVEP